MKITKVSILYLILILLSCSLFYEETTRVSRGSLSEAMEKSSDDYKEERKVEDSHRRYESSNDWDDNDDDYKYVPTKRYRANVYVSPPSTPSIFDKVNPNKNVERDTTARRFFGIDTTKHLVEDSTLKKFTDSTGRIDLEKYRLQLSLPFIVEDNIDKITISSSDSSGRTKDYVIEKTVTTNIIHVENDSSVNNNQSSKQVIWHVKEQNKELYIGAQILTGLKYSSKYSNITGGSIVLAWYYDEKRRAAFNLGAAYLPSKEDSDLLGSIDDLWELHLGFEHRFYITSDKSFVGAYIPLEATLRTMFWNYRNPITTDLYDETGEFLGEEEITGDGLWGLSIGSGFGVSLIQTNSFKLSTTVAVGGTLNRFETHEGFDNDVFVGDLYLKVAIEVLFGLR